MDPRRLILSSPLLDGRPHGRPGPQCSIRAPQPLAPQCSSPHAERRSGLGRRLALSLRPAPPAWPSPTAVSVWSGSRATWTPPRPPIDGRAPGHDAWSAAMW